MGNTIIGNSNNVIDEEVAGGRPGDQNEDNDVFYDTVTEDDYTTVVVGVRPKYYDPHGEDDPVLAPPREDDPALDPFREGDPAPAPPCEGDPVLAPPSEDDPAPPLEGETILAPLHEDNPALAPPHKDDQMLAPPHEGASVLAPSHEDNPARALPHEGDSLLATPHEGDPMLALAHEGDLVLAPLHEDDSVLALPHDGDSALAVPREGDPFLAPSHEGVPALSPQNGGTVDATPYEDGPQVGWTGLKAMTQPMDEFITMEWEDDMSDPFERALARRNQLTTTQAESQISTTEDKETHTLWQTMKNLETGGGQQESKALQYYPDEETEPDKEHNKTLQHHLEDSNGKNSRTPQHYTGEGKEKDAETLKYYTEEDENDRTLQHRTDEEEKDGKALQHYPYEENCKNVKTQYHYPYEKKDKDVKTKEDQDCRTLHHYAHEEGKKDGKTMQQYPYEEEDKDGKTMQQYPYEEEDKDGKTMQQYPYEEEDKDGKTMQQYPYEEEDKDGKTMQQYPYEEEDKDGKTMQKYPTEEEDEDGKTMQKCPNEEEDKDGKTIQQYPYEEEDKDEKTVQQYPYEEEDKDEKTVQQYPYEEEDEDGKTVQQYPYEEEDKYEKTMQQYPYGEEEKNSRAQHHCPYKEEEKEDRVNHHRPYEEEGKDGKTHHQFSYKEEEKNGRTLQHYLNEGEDKGGRRVHHYTKEGEGKVVRTQHYYPYEEEDKDDRTLQRYTDDDDRTLHHYPNKKEEKDGRALLHYPYEEEEKTGKTQHHYPYEEDEENVRALHPNPYEDEDTSYRTQWHYPYEEKNQDSQTLLDYPHEEEEKDGGTLQHYPYEEKEKVERTQQHYPYEREKKVGRTQKYYADGDEDGTTLHHDPNEEERDKRTLEHYAAKEENENGTRQLDSEKKEDTDRRTLQHVTDEDEEDDSRRQQNHTDEGMEQGETRQLHHTFEGRDSSMHTSDQHNQYPQGQERAARSVLGRHHWRGPSRGHTFSWRNKHISGEDDGYENPLRHQYSLAHRSHPYHLRGHKTQRQGSYCNSGHYYRNGYNSHYSSALNGGYAGIKEDEGGVMKPEKLAEALVECHAFHSTLMNLLQYQFLDPKSVQQVAAAHPTVFHLDKNGVQLQPQIKLCQAFPSAQGCPNGLSCPNLHVCKTYVSGWCSEKPCPLGHSLYTNHNKAILKMFCLGHLPSHRLKKLLRHLTITTAPPSSYLDVCRGYNRGQCDTADCQALHLCLSFVVGCGRCGRANCSLNHNPNTPECCRLLTAHGISVNETIMDIIVALLSANPALTTADATVPLTPARMPNTQASLGSPNFKKPGNFFDRVKQKFGLLDNSPTRRTFQESYSERNRESAPHYKSDKDSQELGAVGGKGSAKSSNNHVPQKQEGRHSSSGKNASGRTEGSHQAVWAHHRQGNIGASEICRFSVESVCPKEGKGCSRLHASWPFHWQVCDGEGQDSWLNLPGTIITCLETAFCDPAKNGVRLPPLNPAHLRRLENVLDPDTWYANFEAMVLTNSDYSKVVALRRLCVQAGAAAPYTKSRTYSWYFCDINGRWIKYGQADTSGQASRASSITSADIEAHYLARPNVPLSFKVSQYTYHINFGAMTQTNQTTKVQRAVRRRPELYVDASNQRAPTGTKATSLLHMSK